MEYTSLFFYGSATRGHVVSSSCSDYGIQNSNEEPVSNLLPNADDGSGCIDCPDLAGAVSL